LGKELRWTGEENRKGLRCLHMQSRENGPASLITKRVRAPPEEGGLRKKTQRGRRGGCVGKDKSGKLRLKAKSAWRRGANFRGGTLKGYMLHATKRTKFEVLTRNGEAG